MQLKLKLEICYQRTAMCTKTQLRGSLILLLQASFLVNLTQLTIFDTANCAYSHVRDVL